LEPAALHRWARTVTDGEGEVLLAPSSRDGVDVAAADTAALDLDIDIVVAKGLGLELVLVEFQPRIGSVDLEAGELLWVRHLVVRCWRSNGGRTKAGEFLLTK